VCSFPNHTTQRDDGPCRVASVARRAAAPSSRARRRLRRARPQGVTLHAAPSATALVKGSRACGEFVRCVEQKAGGWLRLAEAEKAAMAAERKVPKGNVPIPMSLATRARAMPPRTHTTS
jgi:hypothetical protein